MAREGLFREGKKDMRERESNGEHGLSPTGLLFAFKGW